MGALIQQVRIAARSLIRAPYFTAAAILTLALGIGLSTAVFTVADTLLIHKLPIADQNRVLVLSREARGDRSSKIPLALNDVRDFERRSQSLASVAFFAFRGAVPAPRKAKNATLANDWDRRSKSRTSFRASGIFEDRSPRASRERTSTRF